MIQQVSDKPTAMFDVNMSELSMREVNTGRWTVFRLSMSRWNPSLLNTGCRLFFTAFIVVGILLMAAVPRPLWAQASPLEPLVEDVNEPVDEIKVNALPLEDLRIFAKTYDDIRKSYVSEIDDATLLEYAIRGMINELDPHSSYLDQSSYTDLQVHTTGEFGGIGIEVGTQSGLIKVVSPIDDTPAARAGIEAGDLISKIDGENVQGMNLDSAIDRMRGVKGSEISLTIMRIGAEKPLEFTLKRDTIKVRSVRSSVLKDDYGYIRIAQFQINTGKDVKKAYKDLIAASPQLKGIILDLRNNPGGVLQASVEVVDQFLDGGLVVYTEGRLADSNQKFHAKAGDISNGLPLVVLINDGSASASEIVAGALQDQKRALVLGTRSFGKGSVQSVIPIDNERAVKLTTARYFTPDGHSIQAQGIVPDIIIERVKVTAVQPQKGITEADLTGHLTNANGKDEMDSKSREVSDTDLQNKDSQLYEALTLLKGLALFGERFATDSLKGDSKRGLHESKAKVQGKLIEKTDS